MAGYVFGYGSQILTPTAYVSDDFATADNTDTGDFPKMNIGIWNKPYRPYKSANNVVSGTTYVGVKFSAATTLAGVVIDNINITSVKIQGAADAAFSSGLVDSTAVGCGQNEVDGRYKRIYTTAGGPLAAQSKQYWRILANASTTLPTGTAGKMSVGSVVWLVNYTTWASGTTEYDETPIEATRPNDDFAGGGSEPVILGNPTAAIGLTSSPASRTAMRSDALAILRQGIGRWFVFAKDPANAPTEVYVCRRAVDVTLRQTSCTVINFSSWVLEGAC